MRTLLKCDLFRVVQDKENHLTPPNRLGVAASFITGVLLVILLAGEFVNYFQGHQQCSLAPNSAAASTTAKEEEQLRQVKLQVTLPHIPCERVMVELLSEDKAVSIEVQQRMEVTRYPTAAGSFEWPTRQVKAFHDGQQDAKDMGCSVQATAPLLATPANLNIIVKGYTGESPLEFSSEHAFHQLQIGDRKLSGFVSQVTPETAEPLSGTVHQTGVRGKLPNFYMFYVQYVRTRMALPRREPFYGFQYTSDQSLLSYNGKGRAPGVYLRLVPSPFAVHCSIEYDSISHFLVHLCAVAGGIYTVASLLELAVETIVQEQKRRERVYQNALNTEKAEKQKLVDAFVKT